MADEEENIQDYNFYPPVAFNFSVEVPDIEGINEGNFQEVTGLTVKLGSEEVKEGGENRFVHRLPSPPKYENITLKRGMLLGSPLITWARNAVEQFTFAPKTVVIKLLDEKGNPLATWNVVNAYPVALKYSEFKAQDNTLVFESIELSYNYFQKIQ